MSAVAADLQLRVRRPRRAIPEADLPKLTSEAAAVRYACENSGLQDKSIAIEIGVDTAVLSKAKAGQARLNDDALDALQDATGIEAPLLWMLFQRGYDLHSLRKRETETEQKLREVQEALQRERTERQAIERAMRRMLVGAAS